jgi:hypothetical protein
MQTNDAPSLALPVSLSKKWQDVELAKEHHGRAEKSSVQNAKFK